MSKTPLCDLRSARAYRCTYNEFIEVLEFARKLETDRAELVEALSMLVERDARRAGPMLLFPFDDSEQASFVLSEARALLARLEAE